MSIINLRLPEELIQKLTLEAERANRSRSDLARDAIVFYLDWLQRERFLCVLESAAKSLALDPEARGEALQRAKDFLPFDNESLALGENSTQHKASAGKPALRRRTP